MRNSTPPVKRIKHFFLFALTILAAQFASAQFISYPVASAPVTRGLDSTLLTVQVTFPTCAGVTVTINLGASNTPGLVEYIPGSVAKISGTGTITESNISNLAAPVFTVGNTTAGQILQFSIKRRAFCGAAASTKDNVIVAGAGCSFSETDPNVNSYNLLSSAFTITAPVPLTGANVGDSYNRTIAVINGGNGCADTVGFWIKYPAGTMQLNSLSYNGTPLTPLFTNGDSSYFKLFGSVLGTSNSLCNGESVTLVENVTLLACNVVTTYGAAGFDFSGSRCQVTTANSGMTMNSGVPSITVTPVIPALSSCFVSAPRLMTYVIKNNGAGAATDIVINTGNHLNNTPRSNSYGYIDTASLMLSIAGAAAAHPDPSLYSNILLTINSASDNTLACNVGKPCHMQINLPASTILAPGDSIVLTYNIVYCSSTNTCDEVFTGAATGTQALYKNSCRNTSFSTGNYAGLTSFPYNAPAITAFEVPAQVRSGECYNVILSAPSSSVNYIGFNGYFQYEVTMPAGVTFSSASMIGTSAAPLAGYPIISGNKVITRYTVPSSGNPVKFVFCTPPVLCTTSTIDVTITSSADSTCSSINTAKRCASNPISFICTAPCPAGGIVPTYWKYNRSSYGLPDNDFNKLPDASGSVNPAIVFEDRYRPGDTLHSEYRSYVAAQTSPLSIVSWNHINANWNFSKHIWAPSGTATVTIKRGGSTTVVPGVPVAVVTYGKVFNADFSNAPVALTSLAPFLPNDSVIVEANFMLKDSLLSTNITVANTTAVDDGTRGKTNPDAPDIVLLTNSVYASTMASPAPANQATCFTPQYNANVLHMLNFALLYGSNLVGCTAAKQEVRSYTRKLSTYTANYFPGEYRPEFIPDSIVLNFPQGMTVSSNTQTVSGIYNNTPPTSSLVTPAEIAPYISIAGNSVSGTTVTFDVKNAFAVNPSWKIQSEGTTITFSMDARGGCETPNNFSVTANQIGHIYQWPSSLNEGVYNDSARTQTNSTYSNVNKPTLTISSPNPTIAPGTDTACWTVILQNSSGQQAPFTFIKLTPNASFDNYVVKVGSTTIAANGDGIYELGSLNAAGVVTLSICANTNSCALDSFKVESGWDCAGYPTGTALSSFACWQSIGLKANPLQSQIQLTVDKQPASEVTLCTNDTIIFKINSALANYADNAVFRVFVPTGMTIAGGEIEYPSGSNIWQAVVPVNDNGVLVYSTEAHSAVAATGLPGTISNPGTANRAARLRLIYTTSCDFVSGSKINVQQQADRPCGEPISTNLGYNAIVRTNPILITGANNTGNASFGQILSPATILCTDNATISGGMVITGTPSSATDTIVVTIPAGLIYAGNFLSPNGVTVVSGYPQAGIGGSQILKLKVPAGILAGTLIDYSYNIQAASVESGCGNLGVQTELQRTLAPLMCGVTTCVSGAKLVIGSTENTVTVSKPDLSIVDFDYVSGSFAESGTATVTLTVANSSSISAAAESFNVEFFCGSSTVPFASGLFTPAIPASGSVSGNITITIPAAPACMNGDIVTATIRPVTETNAQQCLCKETSRQMLRALPTTLTDFSARQQNCKVTINWSSAAEIDLKQYDLQQSIDDGQTYGTIATIVGKGDNSHYMFTHQPTPGRNYYRLLMIDRNGTKKYSNIITVNSTCTDKMLSLFPNPAFNMINVNLSGYSGKVSAKLYSSTGQLVVNKLFQNGRNSIAVSQLAKGTYALIVTEQNGTQKTYKVYVSH